MPNTLTAYRWRCPICSDAKSGLSTMPTVRVEDQARDALLGHVRTKVGGGHGRSGTYPPGFGSVDVLDFVEFEGEDDEASHEEPLPGRVGL